jgi:hypothetical protein
MHNAQQTARHSIVKKGPGGSFDRNRQGRQPGMGMHTGCMCTSLASAMRAVGAFAHITASNESFFCAARGLVNLNAFTYIGAAPPALDFQPVERPVAGPMRLRFGI